MAEREEPRRAKIIRVHGTFAGIHYLRPKDKPDKHKVGWHEDEHEFCRDLKKRLASTSVDLADDLDWCGHNLESERYLGALKVLKVLTDYEKAGKYYHIIAHSHGGSVVWKALRLAETRKWRKVLRAKKNEPSLSHLRSWTTLGTPFLSFAPSVVGELLTLSYQVGVTWILIGLSYLLRFWLEQRWNGEWVNWIREEHLVGLGSALTFFLMLQSAKLAIARIVETRNARPSEYYIPLWLGLTSRDDEAVNGLGFAVGLKNEVIKKFVAHDSPFLWKPVQVLKRAFFWPIRALFNSTLIPLGNRFIRRQLKKLALGDNLPFTRISKVEQAPFSNFKLPALPDEISRSLTKKADDALAKASPGIRKALQTAVTAAGDSEAELSFRVAAGEFNGKAFVHTSYFDDEEMRELLADHVRLAEEKKAQHHGLWIAQFKTAVEKARSVKRGFGPYVWVPIIVLAVFAMVALIWWQEWYPTRQ